MLVVLIESVLAIGKVDRFDHESRVVKGNLGMGENGA